MGTTATYTPGPWHVGGRGNAIVYANCEGGNYAVCNAVTYHGQPNYEDAANARFIAAAPDMAAALRDVLATCAGDPVNDAARQAKYKALYRAAEVLRTAEGR